MNASTPLEAAERAVGRLEAASAAHPLEFLDDLAWALSHLANSRSHLGDHDGAVEASLRAHLLYANRPEEAQFAALEAYEWQELLASGTPRYLYESIGTLASIGHDVAEATLAKGDREAALAHLVDAMLLEAVASAATPGLLTDTVVGRAAQGVRARGRGVAGRGLGGEFPRCSLNLGDVLLGVKCERHVRLVVAPAILVVVPPPHRPRDGAAVSSHVGDFIAATFVQALRAASDHDRTVVARQEGRSGARQGHAWVGARSAQLGGDVAIARPNPDFHVAPTGCRNLGHFKSKHVHVASLGALGREGGGRGAKARRGRCTLRRREFETQPELRHVGYFTPGIPRGCGVRLETCLDAIGRRSSEPEAGFGEGARLPIRRRGLQESGQAEELAREEAGVNELPRAAAA
jgi:hypothetical protein